MLHETRTTDAKGRLSLPKTFANATVVIEQVSESELRIRKARVIPEKEFREERLRHENRDIEDGNCSGRQH